jgi:hypothetical protein
MASFDLALRTRASLHPHGEPDEFVTEHTGHITCTRDTDGRVSKVGLVKAYRVHVALAHEAGESLFDVFDAHSQPMADLYAALFDVAQEGLSEAVRDQFDAFDSDLLILDYVLLAPRWRGLRIGLLAARKLVDLLGGGCGLVVSWVCPLNPDADEFQKVPKGWVPRAEGEGEERAARKRLRRHFARMGFERIAGTRYDGLSLTRITPTLADLLRPKR